MDKVTALKFYQSWLDTVTSRKHHLLSIWRNAKVFTSYIKGDENSVMEDVANKLNLLCYPRDYYSIDTILYRPEDKTPGTSPNTYWFRDIRVAFEHENNFKGGLYQEVSHLIITNCDLRVLVTYPNEDTTNELKYLHEIISGNRQAKSISDEESFLIIFGYEAGFEWKGFIYKQDNWKQI
jgi:hypothetical protein